MTTKQLNTLKEGDYVRCRLSNTLHKVFVVGLVYVTVRSIRRPHPCFAIMRHADAKSLFSTDVTIKTRRRYLRRFEVVKNG